MAKLFLNTWIFEDAVKQGMQQAELVTVAHELGADGLEVRREYFNDLGTELTLVHDAAAKENLAIALSIPDELFVDGAINPKMPQYIAELKALGAQKAKFNVGDFANFTGDLKAAFADWPADITINIENDQTALSGHLEPIQTFLEAAKDVGLNIGYVYDLGNWAFTNGDAIKSATTLAPYTDYVHFKNADQTVDGAIVTPDLDEGMFDWRHIYELFAGDVDVALEFPMTNTPQIAEQIAKLRMAMEAR